MFQHRCHAAAAVLAALLIAGASAQQPSSFRFVILGDRTGETRAGVYEQVWKDLARENPAFVVGVGDTIQGTSDASADAQWQEIATFLNGWRRFPLYLAAGNHDIWSAKSEQLFEKYAGHPAHYSFDYAQAHFTILDNSRSDELLPAELAYLEMDLKQHEKQSLKVIVSHRPSWVLKTMLDDPNFELHRIAKKYGVRYIIAGHIHELLHADLDGITYISAPSAGGHLRGEGKYDDGWFFGYTVVDVSAATAAFRVQELGEPYGKGRRTGLSDWGKAGILR